MAQDIILPPPPTWLAQPSAKGINNEITQGVGESFPILSIRSSKFLLRYQGEEKPVLDARGYMTSTLDVIILKAAANLSKAWYIPEYGQGDRKSPDCASSDGLAPDPGMPHTPIDPVTGKPRLFCKGCPNDIIGSAKGKKNADGSVATNPDGTPIAGGKACGDGRRVALMLPPHLTDGEIVPVLLRVSWMSARMLAEYGKKLENAGYSYFAVRTRLSFALKDHKGREVGYPLLNFEPCPVEPGIPTPILDQNEYDFVLKMRNSEQVERLLRLRVDQTDVDVQDPAGAEAVKAAGQAYAFSPQGQAEPAPVVPQVAVPIVAVLPDGRRVQADGVILPPEAPPPAPPTSKIVATLPDGRTVWSDGHIENPAPPPEPVKPAVDRSGWTPITGMPGVWFNPKINGLVNEEGEPYDSTVGKTAPPAQGAPPAPLQVPVQEIIPPGAQPASGGFFGGSLPQVSPAVQAEPAPAPTPEQAKTKVSRPKKVQAEPAPTTAPAANGGAPAVGTTPPGVDSILAQLKGSGGPSQ